MDAGSAFGVVGVGLIGSLGIWAIIRGMASKVTLDRTIDKSLMYNSEQLEKRAQEAEDRATRTREKSDERDLLSERRISELWKALEESRDQNTMFQITIANLQGEVHRLTEKIDYLTRRMKIYAPKEDGS